MKHLVVVDDQAVICRLITLMAEPAFGTTTFTTARAALAHLERGAPCDLLLCDVMLPDLQGPELVRKALAIRPELRGSVVFMSGELGCLLCVDGKEFPVLEKPFGVGQLEAVLQSTRTRSGLLGALAPPERDG